ncbi:hypothetical protein IKF12_03405 [Candidatus Saccharibacteria bacterium]|nr:hypothetical protein [Candidatus Saccharibacteria bacterium]
MKGFKTFKNKMIIGLIGLAVSLIGGVLLPNNVSAANDSKYSDGTMKKWFMTQYYDCAVRGRGMNSTVDYVYADAQNSKNGIVDYIFKSEGTEYLPSYHFQTYGYGMDYINCLEVLKGADRGSVKGLLSYIGSDKWNPKWSNPTDTKKGMSQYGYDFAGGAGDGSETTFIMTINESYNTANTGQCGEASFRCEVSANHEIWIYAKKENGKIRYSITKNVGKSSYLKADITDDGPDQVLTFSVKGSDSPPKQFLLKSNSIDETESNLNGKVEWEVNKDKQPLSVKDLKYNFNTDTKHGTANVVVEDGKYTLKIGTAVETITNMNGSGLESLDLSNPERYILYQHYILNTRDVDASDNLICTYDDESVYSENSDYTVVNLMMEKKHRKCYVKFGGKNLSLVNVWDLVLTQDTDPSNDRPVGSKYPAIKKTNMAAVLKWLNEVEASSLNGVYGLSDTNSTDGEDDQVCTDGSGVLGWILCPIIEGITKVGSWMWDYVEKELMQMPTSQIFASDGGVRQAWSTILNIANIIFVLLFIIVIFSQLTGVGIDNYGIKKILPRLILVAVLVNLSWIICQLALDLSNIFGWGLNSMLTSIAEGIETNVSYTSGTMAGVSEVLLGVGGFALFAYLNPIGAIGAAFAVLGFIITTVISVLVLYLILLIREAGIIMLIVLAPVAIVGYALPNTEKLSKKWFDLFKALLIVYPLCGLVMGGGRLAGVILASIGGEGNTGMKLASMIVQVLPFFLIPMLLKNSLSLMGNIGGKLSTMGKSFGRRTSGAIQRGAMSSARFKDWSQRQQDNMAERRADRTIKNLGNRKYLDRDQKAVLAKAQQTKLEAEQRKAIVERYNDPKHVDAARVGMQERERMQQSKDRTALAMQSYQGEGLDQLQDRWETAFKNGDTDELDAVTNVMNARYGSSAANAIGTSLNRFKDIGAAPSSSDPAVVRAHNAQQENYQRSLATLQRTMNDNTSFAGNMKNKASDAFAMISNGGMKYERDANNNIVSSYANLEHFSKNNEISKDIKDWSTQSGATLQRAIDSGALKADDIEKILNSTDPAIQSGIQSDSGKRDVLQGGLYNLQHQDAKIEDRTAAAQAYREQQAELQKTQQEAANQPTILRTDNWQIKAQRGKNSVVTLREMSDGSFVNAENGQKIDVKDMKKYKRL